MKLVLLPEAHKYASLRYTSGLLRKRGRVVEGTGLENRQGATLREFESHRFRHNENQPLGLRHKGFVVCRGQRPYVFP